MKQLIAFLVLVVLAISGCANSEEESAASLPEGDPSRGETLFSQYIDGAPVCSACHTIDGSTLVGPSLQDYGETASTRKPDTSAEDYTYTSIVRPGAFVVDGFPNAMYSQYRQRLTDRQIADLIAYLLSL
ncbi:MAG: c-type cytochrome [Chloroflexi bacterium]|nr:c-type cytochrome [Chloroflexota bacterium]